MTEAESALLEKKVREYRDKFGEQFPLMVYMSWTLEQVVRKIDSHIVSGKPCNPYDGKSIYG